MKSFASREASRIFSRPSLAPRTSIAGRRSANSRIFDQRRGFGETRKLLVVKPYLLADIGEGITECQVIQWFVKPGARVEQFDPICEVQSDKASVEITSRFDGVIKKLYYEPDDMAKVGKPLVDIDIQSEISAADEALLNGGSGKQPEQEPAKTTEQGIEVGRNDTKAVTGDVPAGQNDTQISETSRVEPPTPRQPGKHASLATPAVRHMIKEHKLNIEDIEGTGRDGRVLKDDVQRYLESAKQTASAPRTPSVPTSVPTQQLEDQVKPLTPVQAGMFKQMTKSLSIPHFLYTDTVDFSSLTSLRKKYNTGREKPDRITPLPVIIKAISLAFQQFPLLNSHLDTTTNPEKPQMVLKGSHNIGVAVDSPSGLLVPVIKNVQNHSIASLAQEIQRLSSLARSGKLTSADLTGATFTVSNIGSIGGGTVAPVIVGPQVGIVGIGKAKVVPAFGENGELIKREECVFSWSADHRVVDGAYVARAAEEVRKYIEGVESMLVRMR
ncbi:Lipoamide acyltransferase component of branched-chain alpha-keto acid dehydrogenase complex, mitochondrial [Curvularia clavata]|uniref:Dihydrolipoamide acetyltransferase component of pyruvate dehydrogenase complex n=1 Tax=Curvularia clavata TaxID=95742 RepID=A0A9Q9DP67_CURCL|nr:Lipoamide acyltransferase component of branched-chain alpha-keto acid dehydrogenase complex, mitochondrial [Curvularia clavata]